MSQLTEALANQYFINGLSPLDIYNNGFIINVSTLINAGYGLSNLKSLGLSKSIFDSVGYSATNLKTAGYTAGELKTAGYTAGELKTAGYTASELKTAGFYINDLKTIEFSAGELKTAGFSVTELIGAGFTLIQLKNIGFVKGDFITTGYNATALKTVGFSASDLKTIGYTVNNLIHEGYTTSDLKTAGYTAGEFKTAGYSISDLLTMGFTIDQLNNAGFTKTDFTNVDSLYTASYLKNAGFTGTNLKNTGFTIQELLDTGFTLYDLRNVGFVKADFEMYINQYAVYYLKNIGYSVKDLLNIGFSIGDLYGKFTRIEYDSANVTINDVFKENGLNITKLGYSIIEIVNAGLFTKTYNDEVEGWSINELKSYFNLTPSNFRIIGYSVSDLLLDSVFNLTELIGAGYKHTDFNSANISISELKTAGFNITDLKTAGYSALELKNTGYNIISLKNVGYTALDLKNAGFSIIDILNVGFQLVELNLNGYTITDFNSIVKTATDLKNAGYSAYNLKTAGYSAGDLKTAGYSISEFIYENSTILYSVSELLNGGYSLIEIKDIISFLNKIDFDSANISANDLKTATYTINNLTSLGFTITDLKTAGFTAEELTTAGYTISHLKTAGYTAREITTAGYTISHLKTAGFTARELKIENFTAGELKIAGFRASELITAGYTISDLKTAGFTAGDLKMENFTARELKTAGFTARELKIAEFSIYNLLDAGFQIIELKDIGYTEIVYTSVGFTAINLKTAGFTATDLKTAEYSATVLKTAEFTAIELKTAGYTISDLKTAGYLAIELKTAGFTAIELKTVGFTVSDLKTAGFTAIVLKTAGFTAIELKDAGYIISDLKTAGFTAIELKMADFTATELKAVGFTSTDLKTAGFSSTDLKIAGFTVADLKTAGYSITEILKAGFKLIQLNNTGYFKRDFNLANITIHHLKAAGYTIIDLKQAGYNAIDLKSAGFTSYDIKAAGFTATDLKTAGFTGIELKNIGYSFFELKDAGYTDYELIDNINEMNNYFKDKQFLQKLCNNNKNNSNIGTSSSSSSVATCRPTIINTIKAKDSTQTQSSKLSNYVQRGKYMKIYEGKIKSINMIFATPTTATIVFVPVGYIKTVTFIANNPRNISDSHSGSTITSPYTLQNLTPNTSYDITAIVAYSSGNTYTEIFTNVIRTLNEGPPTNVRISKITNKTAYITFIKPIGIPSDVNITITNVNDSNDRQYIPNITTDVYLITDLQINNTYTFLMTSIYTKTKNKYSITFTFTTLNEDFPTDIIFTNVNNISATISYKYTGTPLYNSIVVVNNSNPVESYKQDTLQTSISFKLNSNVTYNVIVTSVYTSGNSFPVETYNAFYILNEGPPIDTTIQYIKGTSIFFSFVNSIGNPSSYELILTDIFDNQITKLYNVDNTQNLLVDNLTPNLKYNFQLISNYLQTNNTYIYNTTFQTLNEGIIRDFILNQVGNSFITFSFTYPPGENYNITVIMNNPLDYKTININTNQYTLNGLLINASYNLSINTVYTKSNTTYTYIYPVTIYTLFEGPSIINYVNNITDQTVYMNFSNPYDIPDKYIFVSTNTNIPTNIINTEYTISNSQGGNILITGLLPNSKYITVLNTYYNLTQNIYPSSPGIEIYTKGSPTNIQVGEFITDTSASITFVSPIVIPDKYVLTTNDNMTINIPINQIKTVGNLSYYEINGLTPNTYYVMNFGAYYGDINQLYTQALPFTLTTKGPVQNIFMTTITDTSATLIFNPPLLSYNWEYNVYLNTNTIKSSNTNFIFQDLNKNTSYTVYIEAIYSTSQKFLNNITFNTKSFPYDLSISNVLDTQITLNWQNLLNTPTYYNLIYYPPTTLQSYKQLFVGNHNSTIQVYPSDITTNTQTQISSYNILGLIPDISYTILEISAYYLDINTEYTNAILDLSSVFTKSPPTDISGYNQTNQKMTISFITPLNTKPINYSISAVNTTNNINTEFPSVFTEEQYPDYGTVITYDITDLSDNINYNIFVNSRYYDDTTNNYTSIQSSPYNISTQGTPNILSFTNIYTDSFTINIQPLLIQPINCIFTFYNLRTKQTSTTNGLFNNGKYITPSIFFINDTYNVSIQSIYNNNEIYTSVIKQVSTSSPPILLSYISTDVSAIVYFIPPVNPPNSYKYTTSNLLNSVTVNTFSNYFIIETLQPTTINNIILYSHYSDNNQNYGSDSINIYTKGPPTALNINATDVFNTYINLSFTTAFQCNQYTIHAIPINSEKTSISQILLQTPLFTTNPVNYTLTGLSEDTSYNIYVTSNYDNFNGNSNSLQIHTYKAIQIESITNITDVSAIIIVNTRPSILPTDISFSYMADNIHYGLDIDTIYNSSTDNSYYIFKIEGLTHNTKYDPFTINSYYIQDNVTFVSENKPFSTKGITDINIYVTDISATISFPIPYSVPSKYYYVLENEDPVIFTPTPKIDDNSFNTYTIPNLPPNTPYSHFTIQTEYSDISGTYISQDISFCTKMIPSPTFIVGDTQIDITFTTIKSPYVQGYSYSLDQYTYDYPDVFFPTEDVNGIISLSITGLIPNTFYNFFRINVLYSDINQTYSSKNNAFNTMGSPTGAGLSSPNNNIATLSFYPPLYPPDYYIITNPPNQSYSIYAADISYINNVYSCKIDGISSVKDVNISSYYSILNKTIPVKILTNVYTVIDNNKTIVSIETDSTGKYVVQTQNPNTIKYYSSDYGNTWSTIQFSNVTTSSNNISTDGINVITKTADNGLYFSNDSGVSTNYLLSSYIYGLKNPIISGNGRYIYAYTDTNIYSYAIPVEKGSAYNLTVSNIKDKSVFFSFLQPSFIPDLSYDIIVTNHYIPEEVHKYKTSQNINFILDGLTPNALYDISLNTNYSKEIQTFTTGLTTPFNTLSAPINLNMVGNPTDTSAIIQFIEPIIKPSHYILQINDTSNIIQHNQFIEINVKGRDINYYLQPNDISINSYTIQSLSRNNNYLVNLSSYYDINNTFVSDNISFNTRGYPSNPTFKNIYDTSVNLSFTPPRNINDISGYNIQFIDKQSIGSTYITTTSNNNIINNLSENQIYDIILSTTYLNPLQTLISTRFTNVLYTKGGPVIDVSYLSITDSSAIIQILTHPPSIKNNNSLFLKYQLGIDNVYKDKFFYSSDISFVIVSNLIQNTKYSITIKTFYTDTSSTFISNSTIVPTQGYPANIKSDYNYITDISARIIFDPAYNPPPKGYIVKTYSNINAPVPSSYEETDITYDTYKNISLNKLSTYYLYVGSKYSDTKIFYSPKIPFYMAGPPTDVNYIQTSITDTSANISFVNAILSPLKYTITVKQTDTNLVTNIYDIAVPANIPNTSQSSTKYTLTNLPKNKNLSITYASVYPYSTLTATNILTFATVGPPRNINIVNNSITDTSAIFIFSPPLNSQATYNAILNNITNTTTQTITNITSPYKFLDLSSNSTYELQLQSYYVNGIISNSNVIGFNTQGIVTSIELNNITDTQTTVSYQLCPSTPTSYDLTISGESVSINRTYLNITNPYTVTDLSNNSIYHSKILSNYDSNWNVLF